MARLGAVRTADGRSLTLRWWDTLHHVARPMPCVMPMLPFRRCGRNGVALPDWACIQPSHLCIGPKHSSTAARTARSDQLVLRVLLTILTCIFHRCSSETRLGIAPTDLEKCSRIQSAMLHPHRSRSRGNACRRTIARPSSSARLKRNTSGKSAKNTVAAQAPGNGFSSSSPVRHQAHL